MRILIIILLIFVVTTALGGNQSKEYRKYIKTIMSEYTFEDKKQSCLEGILETKLKVKDPSKLELDQEKKTELVKNNTYFHYRRSGGSPYNVYLYEDGIRKFIGDEHRLYEFGPGFYMAVDPFSSISFGHILYTVKVKPFHKIFDANQADQISKIFDAAKEINPKFEDCLGDSYLRKVLTYTLMIDNNFSIAFYAPYQTGWLVVIDGSVFSDYETADFNPQQYFRDEEVLDYVINDANFDYYFYLNFLDKHKRCNLLKRLHRNKNQIKVANLIYEYCAK